MGVSLTNDAASWEANNDRILIENVTIFNWIRLRGESGASRETKIERILIANVTMFT